MKTFLTFCLAGSLGLTYIAIEQKSAYHQAVAERKAHPHAQHQPTTQNVPQTKVKAPITPQKQSIKAPHNPHTKPQANADIPQSPYTQHQGNNSALVNHNAQPTSPQAQANPHAQPTSPQAQAQANPHNQGQLGALSNPPRPATHPASQPTSQPTSKQFGTFIYGQIKISEEIKALVKPGSVLFVIVRRYAEGGKGMLIAATKHDGITQGSFSEENPFRYVVKQSDAMMGAPLTGKVTVSARIDQDGDAISKQPNDIVGSAASAVMVGVNPVEIELNSKL